MTCYVTYTIDQDAILTYMNLFADKCDIPASADALEDVITSDMKRYYPDIQLTTHVQRGPVTRDLEVYCDGDEEDDTDDYREAVADLITTVWEDGNRWVVDKERTE